MALAPPLARHPVLETRSVDEAEAALGATLAPCAILRVQHPSEFRVTLNALRLGRTTLVFNRYGAESRLESELEEDILYFTYGRAAASTFSEPGGDLVAGPDRFVVLQGGRRVGIHREDGSELLVVRVATADLAQHLRRLTRSEVTRRPTFASEVATTEGRGRSFLGLLRHLIREIADDELVPTQLSVRRAYDEILLTRLLTLPHGLSTQLSAGRRHIVAPGLVRRAEAYLRENLSKAITVSELLDEVDCSRSVLYRAFRSVRGYTPLEFLTEQRLQQARRTLRRRDDASSITNVALSCGFTHLGRFAQAYARRFGERPSDTLRGTRS